MPFPSFHIVGSLALYPYVSVALIVLGSSIVKAATSKKQTWGTHSQTMSNIQFSVDSHVGPIFVPIFSSPHQIHSPWSQRDAPWQREPQDKAIFWEGYHLPIPRKDGVMAWSEHRGISNLMAYPMLIHCLSNVYPRFNPVPLSSCSLATKIALKLLVKKRWWKTIHRPRYEVGG